MAYRIVIVDDEYIVSEGIKTIIEREGLNYKVVGCACNGMEGVEVIRRERPDIVLTDIRMPGKSGLQMIEDLKEEDEIEFVVISGHQEFEYARTALKLGVRAYIDKPLTIQGICEVLEKMEVSLNEKKRLQKDEYYKKQCNKVYELIEKDYESGNKNEWQDVLQAVFVSLKECGVEIEKYKRELYAFVCCAAGVFYDGLAKSEKERHMPLYENMKSIDNYVGMDAFVLEIIRSIFEKKRTSQFGGVHKVIERIVLYLDEHYQEDIGLAEVADMVGVNYTYLSILFKEEIGMSFVKYLTKIRIEQSKKLLNEGYRINEVAGLVGYSNYRYFCEIFKKGVGMTPSEYKGNVRKKLTF